MLTQMDGNEHVTTFEYNVQNKALRRIDHGGRTGSVGSYTYNPAKTESYTYYANGNLYTKVDRNGNTTTYTYNSHGKLLSESVNSLSVIYAYDGNGNKITMTDSTGTTKWAYDELNRNTTKYSPGIGTITYKYDLVINTILGVASVPTGCIGETTKDPKGNSVTSINDGTGKLAYVIDGAVTIAGGGITNDTSTYRTVYKYKNNGNRESVEYPSHAKEEYVYFNNNLLQTLTNKKPDSSVLETFSYTYDEANNQVTKVDSKGTTSFSYDILNRLEKVTEPGGTKVTEYSFDDAGNRYTESVTQGAQTTVTTYTYNEQNRLTSTSTKNASNTEKILYVYDGNGNMLNKTAKETTKTANQGDTISFGMTIAGQTSDEFSNAVLICEYDDFNQLIRSRNGTQTLTYVYDGEGTRVSKTVNGVTTKYFYDEDNVILELDSAGVQTAKNLYGSNLLSRLVSGTTVNFMYNAHGDTTALINSSGTTLATYYYDPFGNITEQTGSVNNPIRYAGYMYDSETGLYYLQSRYYDSKIARFLSEDTYRGDTNDPLSLNLYTYCHNEPIMYTDPDGHTAFFFNKKYEDNDDEDIDLGGLWNNVKLTASNLWDGAKEATSHPIDTLKGIGNSFIQGGGEILKVTSTVVWGMLGNTEMASQVWTQTTTKQEQVSSTIQKTTNSQMAFVFGNNLGYAAQMASGATDLLESVTSLGKSASSSIKSGLALETGESSIKGKSSIIVNKPMSTISKSTSDVKGVSKPPEYIEVNPKELNYSQRTVNKSFDTPSGKQTMQKVINKGPEQVKDFPPVKAVVVKGQLVVRDGNSRLLVAQETKAPTIKVEVENSNIDAVKDLNKRLANNKLSRTGTKTKPSTK